MHLSTRFLAGAFALSFVAITLVRSAEPAAADYTNSTWALLNQHAVLSAAADITTAKLPNCDYAIVDARQVRTYRADGTGQSQDEQYTKVLTERGRRMKRIITRNFMLPYSAADVVTLELVHSDGSVVPIDVKANARESIDSSQMSANIYDPNMRVLQVNVPGLQIGDVIHSVIRETLNRAIIPGEFSEENVFEEEGYIRHITYEVTGPAAHPLKHMVIRDEVPNTITSTQTKDAAGNITYRWEVNAVPRMYSEPAMPSPIMTLQRLFVTTLSDWPAVSRWYWNVSAPHLAATSPDMKQNVDALIANTKTDTERLKAIFYYVSKNIRYMGITPEKDRPGFEPHDVRLTYAKKYGVCRDKAALLVAMLRTAGFDAYPVLESYGWRKDADAPDPDFNHAIVAVDRGHNDYLLMDPTDENTLDFLPAEECNWSYLVCRPEGDQIRTIPVQSPEQNLMTIHTSGSLDAGGTLIAKADMAFAGINDNAYRSAFAQMKPDDRLRFFEGTLKRALPGARVTALKLTPENLLDRTQALRAELDFVAPGITVARSGKSIVSLPWLGRHFGIVSFLLRSAGLEQRKYPFQTFVACGVREELGIKLSPDYTGVISMPSCVPDTDACKSYGEHVSLANGMLSGTRNLDIKVAEFSIDEYRALKQTLQTMAYDERKAAILAVADRPAPAAAVAASADVPVESDTKLLESDEKIAIQDAHTAVLTFHTVRKVLTYNGKKSASEYKLGYNPSWAEAKLIRARVTSAEGKVQEISPGEVNVMDADWNASAKRYTGGKILVANLPGVEIGSTLEVDAELTIKNKAFISGFVPFQHDNAVVKSNLTLTSPATVPIHWNDHNPAGLLHRTSATENGVVTSQWTAENIPPLAAEPNTPPEWSFISGVQYFAGDPTAYWNDLHAAMKLHASHGAQAAALARKLANEAHGGAAAVTAIRDYVVKSIRLAGPSFTDLPLAELSDADTTLADGYGHAADRAILLYAMLEAAGFKPDLVLASDLPPVPGLRELATSIPLPHAYANPLVRVTMNGQAYYLNDTDQYARLGSTNHDGDLALVLGDNRYETIHAAPDCGFETKTSYAIAFDEKGTARITIDRNYYGPRYDQKKRFFLELPPEERRRYYEQLVSSVAQGARPLGALETKFDTYPGTEQFTVEIDHYGVVDGSHFYFSMPFTPSLIPVESDRRTLPFYIERAVTDTITAEINLPPSYTQYVITPLANHWAVPANGGSADITATNQPGRSVINYRFHTEPAIISPAEYPDVVNIASALGNRSTQLFLIDKGGEQPSEAPADTRGSGTR